MASNNLDVSPNVNPENGGVPAPQQVSMAIYDYEEGIKKYQRKIYAELIDVVQGILPEALADMEEKNAEEIKGYHTQQMNAWRTQRRESRLRGGGGNTANYFNYNGGGMYASNNSTS